MKTSESTRRAGTSVTRCKDRSGAKIKTFLAH